MRWVTAVLLSLLFISLPLTLRAGSNEVDQFLKPLLSKASIVKTTQIKIPGYPNAYNPSLIPYKEGYLLSFRYTSRYPESVKIQSRSDASFVGLVRLDKKFRVSEKTVQLLNIMSHSPTFSLSAEDARLFKVGERIFIIFNDLPLLQTPGKFAMYLGELHEEQGKFVLKEASKPLRYAHAIHVEKNWSPFSIGDKLYLIYSDQPRVILEVDLNTGYCNEVSRTVSNGDWNLGEIRGGTPSYLVNDAFLTFFHSSFPAKISKGRAYVMGAYTFDKEPPFSIRSVTPGPLGDLTFYSEDNQPKVVFPAGLVIQDQLIHVSWGKADKQILITTFNKEKLLSSMRPY
jgi:predicted GH43/DUF377 family glycosyl hydrolase